MGITVSSLFIGHPVTTYTTTVTVAGGFASSDTTSSEGFQAGPNRWGQAGVQIKFYNEDARDIKYVKLTVFPFNQVRDVVGGIFNSATLTVTGPIKAHHSKTAQWNYVWDGSSISSVGIGEAEIVYFDGTSETVSGSDLHYDRSLKYGLALPITFLCFLILFTITSLLLPQRYYDNLWLMPCQPILLFIMTLFPFAGMFFSRNLKKRSLAIASTAIGVAASAISLYLSVSVYNLPYSYYSSSWQSVLQYYYYPRTLPLWVSPAFSLAIRGFVMSIAALLCAFNVFRKKPQWVENFVLLSVAAVEIFALVAFWYPSWVSYYIPNNTLYLFSGIASSLLSWYLVIIALRFRTDYSAT